MDEFEITGIVRDWDGTFLHYGVKGHGIQNVGLVEKLIREEACSFFIYDGEEKRKLYIRSSPDETFFLTTDPNGLDMNTLNFLPLLDKPLLRQMIESVR